MTSQKDPKKVNHSLLTHNNTLIYTYNMIFIICKTIVEWLTIFYDYQNILLTSSRGVNTPNGFTLSTTQHTQVMLAVTIKRRHRGNKAVTPIGKSIYDKEFLIILIRLLLYLVMGKCIGF